MSIRGTTTAAAKAGDFLRVPLAGKEEVGVSIIGASWLLVMTTCCPEEGRWWDMGSLGGLAACGGLKNAMEVLAPTRRRTRNEGIILIISCLGGDELWKQRLPCV